MQKLSQLFHKSMWFNIFYGVCGCVVVIYLMLFVKIGLGFAPKEVNEETVVMNVIDKIDDKNLIIYPKGIVGYKHSYYVVLEYKNETFKEKIKYNFYKSIKVGDSLECVRIVTENENGTVSTRVRIQ